jgi:hypothetical protein
LGETPSTPHALPVPLGAATSHRHSAPDQPSSAVQTDRQTLLLPTRKINQLKAGEEWKGTDDYVFITGRGEPIYPDTVSSLMRTLIVTLNQPKTGRAVKDPLPLARLHDLRGRFVS